MSEIINLKPSALWRNFQALCDIPRPSKHEAAVVKFVSDFGRKLGLETIVDEVGNVIIHKPATRGMENKEGVILQSHVDMVPQKNSDIKHDFEKDPIQPYIEGEWVKAKGTTLGADNGIGVAVILSILEAKDIEHGPIEALFTIDEETGMTGANFLKPGLFKGKIFINLDSEEEGELYIGCAGGLNANITFHYKNEEVPSGSKAFKLALKGLKGGHSGGDIHLGRGNANKLMNRFLKSASKDFELRLASIDGGSLRNAIPRESFAIVVVPSSKTNTFLDAVKKFEDIIKAEFAAVEPNIVFAAQETALPSSLIDFKTQQKLICSVYSCPNGVIRMSDSMPGLVETSNNLASIKSNDGEIAIQCLLRSSVDSAKDDLAEMIHSAFELAGAEILMDSGYPGWKPNVNSPILKVMEDVYLHMFKKKPGEMAIHAGLECGLLGGVYPHWDMISCGPTIVHPHSPDEGVNIASVQRFWDYLKEVLKNIPSK
jgi:dipeptidase D